MHFLAEQRVLIVDDDLTETFQLQKILTRRGFAKIDSVGSGDQAIRYLKGVMPFVHRKLPDVIFLDLKMAGVDGFEFLAWLKEETGFKQIPVVVFSGSQNPVDREKALKLGAEAYFEKTSDVSKLEPVIEEVLRTNPV